MKPYCLLFFFLLSAKEAVASEKPTIIVVDGLSTGRLYPEVGGSKYRWVNLLTRPQGEHFFSEKHDVWDVVIRYDGARSIAALRAMNPVAAFIGSDLAAPRAGKIIPLFDLPQNLPELAKARYHKPTMQQRLADLGIPYIETIGASSWEAAKRFIQGLLKVNPKRRFVLKPPADGGSQNVHTLGAQDLESGRAERVFASLLGHRDSSGNINEVVTVQRFIRGPEIEVDSVTIDPAFFPEVDLGLDETTDFATAIVQYFKVQHGSKMVYHLDMIMPHNGEAQRSLLQYRSRVLRALGYRIGSSHMEVFWDIDENQWVLGEVGERDAGGDTPVLVEEVTGYHPLLASLDSRLNPSRLIERLLKNGYSLKKSGAVFHLIAAKDGRTTEADILESLKNHKAFYGFKSKLDSGRFEKTTNLDNSPGTVFMSGSRADLEKLIYKVSKVEDRIFGASQIPLCDVFDRNMIKPKKGKLAWDLSLPGFGQ